MLRRALFILLLSWMAISIQAQGYPLAGQVLDDETGDPIEYVTAYVNGTTRGTTTDSEGRFVMEGIVLPCELVLSHVSYKVRLVTLADTTGITLLNLRLRKKVIKLLEVTVIHDRLREVYLSRFKGWFLGSEYRSLNAEILNDSALIFIALEGEQFEAYSNEPLEILLPETGYRVKTELVHFNLNYKEELGRFHCSILGYFFFEEIIAQTRRKQRAIARNRVETFYNTRLHFCRSLYNNPLADNGYQLNRICYGENENPSGDQFEPDFTYWYANDQSGSSVLHLSDFPCRTFTISFYHKSRNKPIDLTYLYAHPENRDLSRIWFLKDTIRIYPSGRVAENSILFNNTIGEKGVAWMLPDDYIPSMQ